VSVGPNNRLTRSSALLRCGVPSLLLAITWLPVSAAEGSRALVVLETHCLECHGGQATKAGLDLSTREGLLRGGESSSPAVMPGTATASLLYRKIMHADEPAMPYKRDKLSAEDIAAIAAWIDAGAPYDRPLRPRADDEWWSLRPLKKPAVPRVKNPRWERTPIDRFILAKLEEKGLTPSPPTDKRTLLRRVTFNLTGLPPSPEELRAFLADTSAEAYERVVQRLLSSPRYGERWARHWMDVVHYAETHGHDQDRIRTNAWPYRDYLIRSFNEDKPYARFVEEQLAGDVLYPEDPQGIVATGFIATGPWDESSLRDIREDTIDRQIGRYIDRDDMLTTAMNTFVSSTVQCARCHDHKFDPISQEDYYALQAVFAGVDKAERPYDLDPQINLTRQALLKRKTAYDVRPPEVVAELLSAVTQVELAAWEEAQRAKPSIWSVLEPLRVTSSNGVTLTPQADLSVLASGTRPERDTYTVVAVTGLKGITAIRLEVLSDEGLPQKGPGRQDNGNFHLSEFRVSVAPKGGLGTNSTLALQNPSADFNQDGWTIAHAIDGKTNTAWGIYPEVGKSHVAVFETKEDAGLDGGTALTFVLDQLHGGGHLIGRFRLSVTTAPRPVKAHPFPAKMMKILATAPEQRTEQDRIELAAFFRKQQIEDKLKTLPPPRLVYSAANDFTPDGSFIPAKTPRPVHVLKRGDIHRPGETATPGALGCVSGLPARFRLDDPNNEGARRAALARWMTDPRNPLTWRSIVNRVWQSHFGRGFVDTPNDFGRLGALPTHPELLDWLAATFLETGGSLKQLHRLIVTSAVYQQSAQHNARYARLDSDNLYLWRMNRTRLDAESIRDAVLALTDKLDLTMGGPSVMHFLLSPGVHVTPKVDYGGFDVDRPESARRSVYRFVFRTLPDPFMETLDCPDSSQLTAKRTVSVTALQALAMLNNAFVVRQSEHLAERLRRTSQDLGSQVHALYELALARPPTPREAERLSAYAKRHGLANASRLVLNSNEFTFIN
jgi:mono/diheme cytochrome c family protein